MVITIIYRLVRKRKILYRLTRSRFFYVVSFFIITWIVSALLFYYSEHIVAGRGDVDLWTSLYWSIITMATIGYGDVTPVRGLGWIVAGFTAVAGIAVYTLTVSVIADWFLSTSIRRSLGMAPLKNKEILVIGDSDSCREIIDELILNGYENMIGWLTPTQPKIGVEIEYLVGDPEDESILKKAGVEKAKHVFLCLSNDSKTLHVTLLVKHLNKNCNVYALTSSSKTEELLKELGVKHVLSTKLLGRTIASALFEPGVLTVLSDIVTAKGQGDLIEIKAHGKLHGKTIEEVEEELNSDPSHRYRIIALVRGQQYIIAPDKETHIQENDTIVALKAKKT